MQLSISARLVLLVTLLVTASATTISYFLYQSSSHILVTHALEDLSHSLQREGDQFSNRIEELQRDVLFLAGSPPIPGLIRAAQNRGYDAEGHSSKAQWLSRLASLFQTMLSTNPDYFQVRLLDAHGRELLKLQQYKQGIRQLPAGELQDKNQTTYFQSTKSLPAGKTYISPIELNREFGKISRPHTPVLRSATPIYHAGKLFGILIINLDFSHHLVKLEKAYSASNDALYVTNSQGAYLSHPDPAKRFGFELGHHFRIQEDFPLLADLFAPSNRELSRHIIPDSSSGNIMVFVKIPIAENNPDKFIAVGLERSYAEILAGETKILHSSLAIISLFILLSVLFALGFGSLLVRPLKQIVANLQDYSTGDKPVMPIRRKDEIGILARALENMADNIFASHQELRTLNARLEDEVEARTEEVQHNLQLLNTISQAQTAFIGEPTTQHAFEIMLSGLLQISESEYGFIGEVLHHQDGTPYLQTRALSNIARDEASQKLYADNAAEGLEFLDLDTLFAQVMVSGKAVINTEPASDQRAGSLVEAHPPLNAFLGIPIYSADRLVGVAGVANRRQGYNETVLQSLEPFITTCAHMLASIQAREASRQKDKELQQTRAELERVTNISPVIFYVVRAHGDFGASFVSPNIKQLMGYEPEECLADAGFWRNNIHPDDREKIITGMEQVFDTGHHVHSYRFRDKAGHYHWIHDELQLIRDNKGEPKELTGYWLDITEQKQAELNLQQSERELATILDNLPLMLFLKDARELRFTQFNQAGEKLLGIPRADLLGKNDYDFFPKEQADFFIAKDREVINGRAAIDIPEEPIQTPQGQRILHTRKTVITDADGEPLYLLGLSEDITEAKQTQDELTRFKSTLDQTQDCVFMFSADTLQYFYVNQGAMLLVGYSQEELLQLHPYEINNRLSNAAEFKTFVKPLLEGQESSFTFDTEYRCKDQTLVPVEVILQYITHEGQSPRFVAMVRDISERKKIDRMKNEFISTVSHELRTPLTSIHGSLGLITGGATGEIPEALGQMIQIASSNTDRLLLLINDILDIQKIESGQMDFQFKPIDVMSLLKQAIEANTAYADQYKVRFQLSAGLENIQILGDHARLMQVLNNLMSNAAKFSPEGAEVELAAEEINETVRISITDHGEGIPEDFLPSLFDQFTQSDSSDSRQKGGTGLGLSIVKAITEKHHGRVNYRTARGQGTTMFIELPLHAVTEKITSGL